MQYIRMEPYLYEANGGGVVARHGDTGRADTDSVQIRYGFGTEPVQIRWHVQEQVNKLLLNAYFRSAE